MAAPFDQYETVIGLECHVQLATKSKLFSIAPSRFGDEPNTNVDFVDAGLPGVLPVLNDAAVRMAVQLGLALGCKIRQRSEFARKHYFYPDLPKGYQTTQFDKPICEGGSIELEDGHVVRIERIHIEEDAGKSVHEDETSLLDYNRAGTPLVEVVTEPCMRNSDDAMAFFRELRAIAMAIEVCDGNLQEGSMRADANVSVRKPGADLGQRTETKNLNSIRNLGQAIDAEARRQVLACERGEAIAQETRLWDADARVSRVMRTKEDAHDYRYFPCPDLLPVVVTDEELATLRETLGELPRARAARYVREHALTPELAARLTQDKDLAAYFETALAEHDNAPSIANWIVNEVVRDVEDFAEIAIAATDIAALVRLVDEGTVSSKIAKQVFANLSAGETDPAAIVEREGWKVERDEGALLAVIDKLIADNAKQVEQYRAGKTKVLGFFVGQVMKETKGSADPAELNRLLKERLS